MLLFCRRLRCVSAGPAPRPQSWAGQNGPNVGTRRIFGKYPCCARPSDAATAVITWPASLASPLTSQHIMTRSNSLRSDFIWGFATAAAQIEGGGADQEKASGRGPSVSRLSPVHVPRALGHMLDAGTRCGATRAWDCGMPLTPDLGLLLRQAGQDRRRRQGHRHLRLLHPLEGRPCE